MNLKHKFGFTLIELLLAMGIIAFLATATVAIMGNFNRRQNIKIAHDDLKNALAQAKSYALSQVVNNCNVVLDEQEKLSSLTVDRLLGYEVRFDDTTNPEEHSYTIHEVCITSSGDPKFDALGNEYPPIATYNLPKDVFFVNETGRTLPDEVRFKVLTGGLDGVSRRIYITTNDDPPQERAVQVNLNGVIRDATP